MPVSLAHLLFLQSYGLLPDAGSPGWRKRIKNIDALAVLLMQALNIQPGRKASITAARYNGAEILLSEQKREEDRQARLNALRNTFVEDPTLSFTGGSHSYDTRGAISGLFVPQVHGENWMQKRVCSCRAMLVFVALPHQLNWMKLLFR